MDAMKTKNRPDEWRIEQGMSGAVLPVLDMTGPKVKELPLQTFKPTITEADAGKGPAERSKTFAAERKGWNGCVP